MLVINGNEALGPIHSSSFVFAFELGCSVRRKSGVSPLLLEKPKVLPCVAAVVVLCYSFGCKT